MLRGRRRCAIGLSCLTNAVVQLNSKLNSPCCIGNATSRNFVGYLEVVYRFLPLTPHTSCTSGLFLLPGLLFLRRPRRELQRVDTALSRQFVLHERVDHAVSRQLHLAVECRRCDYETGKISRTSRLIETQSSYRKCVWIMLMGVLIYQPLSLYLFARDSLHGLVV